MKKLSLFTFLSFLLAMAHAQAPVMPQSQYGRVYTILKTKCQNASCHSATSTGDNLKFDGDSDAVYQQIFNHPSQLWPMSSVTKFEEIVYPQQPYQSFLLRKFAASQWDADMALDTNGDEGNLMYPIAGDTISRLEIEVVRQWLRFGAKEVYAATDPQPDFGTIYQYYNDTIITAFFPKPPAPQAGKGIRLRMGPVFLPTTGPYQEQEWCEQQVVHFPFLPQVTEISGYMNAQSHHFLLFQYPDSISARTSANISQNNNSGASDVTNLSQVTPSTSGLGILGTTSFDGNKNLTAAWQETADVKLPSGTGLMWDQKTYLDMNFHMKNYNATSVLPCDFYFNVYFEPRNAGTIPMLSGLVNNSTDLGEYLIPQCTQIPPKALPDSEEWRQNYADQNNGNGGMRYIWMTAGHTHQWGTSFYVIVQDTLGNLTDTVYDGQYDYVNQVPVGFWDHTHPPLEYWNNGLLPVYYGTDMTGQHKGGLVANTSYFATQPCIHFGFTTANEMQLFYYMYTDRIPTATGINTATENPFEMTIMPNPVNEGNGKIVYVLDNTSKVSSVIVDLSGKVISQLSEETEAAGAHEISLNTTKRLAAGIYFARLVVNGSAYTKKFVVTN